MNFFKPKQQVHPLGISYEGNDTRAFYEQIKELARAVDDGIIPVYERKVAEFVGILVRFKVNYWTSEWLVALARTAAFTKSERIAAGLAARHIEQLAKSGQVAWMTLPSATAKQAAPALSPNQPQAPQAAPSPKQETQRIR